jgi:branched-chain amino acid transport system permease protein
LLQYVIAGLVLGSIYAIAASGLVVTYLSAGILNFAFGALAFLIARFFYCLNTQHRWSVLPAFVISVFVAAPLLGVFLYFALFRLLRLSPPLIKIVATIGLSVMIPPIANLLFGDAPILVSPGLAPRPLTVYQVFDVPVTMDQIVVYICVVAVLLVGTAVLRYSRVGLRVRAMVDSPAMTSLSGTSPDRTSAGVWAASTFLAGLIGVVAAPILQLDAGSYTLLMVAAFAAVIAARLRSLPVAVVVGLLMGVAGSLVQYFVPPSSEFTQAAIPSIPFVVTAIFLVYNIFRRGRVDEGEGVGGALDRSIAVSSETAVGAAGARRAEAVRWPWVLGALLVIGVLPLLFSSFWVSLFLQGVAFGIIFLSFTLVVGEGGMIWLCQVTFAGVGALAAAQLATNHGWPIGLAILGGGIIAVPMGVLLGLLCIRLGDLYVALVTLTFGLLMENLVFSRDMFNNFGSGVAIHRPEFASSDRVFAYVALAVFMLLALLVINVRKSTTGLALDAVRWSPTAARALGVSVVQMKVLVAGLAVFAAGIGGALLATSSGVAVPGQYSTLVGLIWLAVLATLGIRSSIAALLAGLAFTMAPALAAKYLPATFSEISPIFFGLGAIFLAKFPEGTVATNARSFRMLALRVRGGRGDGDGDAPESEAQPEPVGTGAGTPAS